LVGSLVTEAIIYLFERKKKRKERGKRIEKEGEKKERKKRRESSNLVLVTSAVPHAHRLRYSVYPLDSFVVFRDTNGCLFSSNRSSRGFAWFAVPGARSTKVINREVVHVILRRTTRLEKYQLMVQ
jgi:hypothetical protein